MIASVSPEADRELLEAALHYTGEANAAVGMAFIAEFERALALLCTNPALGALWRNLPAPFPNAKTPVQHHLLRACG